MQYNTGQPGHSQTVYQQKQQHIKAKAAKQASTITHTHDAFCTSVLLVEERWMAIHL